MILDAENLFSDAQAITATADSTNIIELPANAADGNPVRLLIQVTETFATLDTLNVDVETDSTSAFSSAATIASSGAIAAATLVAGYKFYINFLPKLNEEFTRLEYTVAGSNATAGKITAGIVFEEQSAKNTYPT